MVSIGRSLPPWYTVLPLLEVFNTLHPGSLVVLTEIGLESTIRQGCNSGSKDPRSGSGPSRLRVYKYVDPYPQTSRGPLKLLVRTNPVTSLLTRDTRSQIRVRVGEDLVVGEKERKRSLGEPLCKYLYTQEPQVKEWTLSSIMEDTLFDYSNVTTFDTSRRYGTPLTGGRGPVGLRRTNRQLSTQQETEGGRPGCSFDLPTTAVGFRPFWTPTSP